MDKSYILENTKQDLKEIIEEINLENLDRIEGEISNYFTFLRSFKNVRHHESSKEESFEKNFEEEKIEINEIVTQEQKPMYLFERKLRGGVVPEIEGFVPESVVRNLELKHGDFVYAEELETDDPNSKRFNYSFAKVGERKGKDDRVEVNYGIVTKVAGSLAVETYLEGSEKRSIKVDGMPYTIVLNEADINYLTIQEGAVIDLAFVKGMPDKHKVLWVHNCEGDALPTIESRSLTYKSAIAKSDYSVVSKVGQTLKGKTVLVVGNEPKKTFYKDAIEKRGGTFIFVEPKDKVDSFEHKVKKADQVIFLLKVSGHTGMEHIKSLCKQYNIPFDTTWSNGVSAVTRMAESV